MAEWKPFTTQLRERLDRIEASALALLDRSAIHTFRNDPSSPIFVVGPSHSFAELDDDGKRLQMALLPEFRDWSELFRLLESGLPPGPRKESGDARDFVTSWLERSDTGWSVPATMPQAKVRFSENVRVLRDVLALLAGTARAAVIAAPDTNALTDEPDVAKYRTALGCEAFEVVLLPTILGELDALKVKARPEYLAKVQAAIRRIKGWQNQGDLLAGVKVERTVTVRAVAREPDFSATVSWFDRTNDDDRFLAGVLELQRSRPGACVVVVSSDLNLRNKAAALGLPYVAPPEQA